MKATGVVRRIDDLGRIVIPKEIRKKLRIRDGENLEILVRDDEIVLKKYSMIGHGLGEVGFAALSLALAFNLPPLVISIPLVIIAAFIIMTISQKKVRKINNLTTKIK